MPRFALGDVTVRLAPKSNSEAAANGGGDYPKRLAGSAAWKGERRDRRARTGQTGGGRTDEPTEGATAEQAADHKANRPLTKEECEQLGQSIIDTCHGTNTRIATIEGWCGDVVTGVGVGTWVSDCEQHIKYVDAVCFASTDSVRSMMDCDSHVSR